MISKPSKSARKREQLALQALGEELIGLTGEQLARIDLDERLREAVVAAQTMRAHGALRRQKQLIGKLMRNVDPEPIRAALDAAGHDDRLAQRIFREAEQWRDRLADGDDTALDALFDYLGHRSDTLVAALRAYRTSSHERGRKHARRSLFREIHREIESRVQKHARNS